MRLISVNVGRPRFVKWRGKPVATGIFKRPVAGRIRVQKLNLEGDAQADLRVHGGEHKALYAYPSEHYAYWQTELPEVELPWGMFGENLTTEGLLDEDVHIGDVFRIGSAEVQVSQPRLPCFKLGIKFGRGDMVKKFLASGRTGFYLRVLEEGDLMAGDPIERLAHAEHNLAVTVVAQLYISDDADPELLRRAVDCEALPESMRGDLKRKLDEAGPRR